jgi:hypothetical protein
MDIQGIWLKFHCYGKKNGLQKEWFPGNTKYVKTTYIFEGVIVFAPSVVDLCLVVSHRFVE